MSRNPIAKALPVHRHQIIPDKREKTLRQLWDEAANEEIPDDLKRLIDRLS
jgi:hypothetical protein